jgi:putative ABC transport system substrate-binding protein
VVRSRWLPCGGRHAPLPSSSGAGGGLIVLPDAFTDVHREQIIALAARHRVPTIYGYRYFAAAGGLISYGFNSAASELAINLKTAKALGLAVPANLLALVDEVIE